MENSKTVAVKHGEIRNIVIYTSIDLKTKLNVSFVFVTKTKKVLWNVYLKQTHFIVERKFLGNYLF